MLNFAVIDTETNYMSEVMSIGIVIADCQNMKLVDTKYYLIEPAYKMPAMYSESLFYDGAKALIGEREQVITSLRGFLNQYGVTCIFAYNASFDKKHLCELSSYEWRDIMRVAAYRQYNKWLPSNVAYCASGRIKSGYKVEDIIKYFDGSYDYQETHNALYDAIDELKIMKNLGIAFDEYDVGRLSFFTEQVPLSNNMPELKEMVYRDNNSFMSDESIETEIHNMIYGEGYFNTLLELYSKDKSTITNVRDYAQLLVDEYDEIADYRITKLFKKIESLYNYFSFDEEVSYEYIYCLTGLSIHQESYKSLNDTFAKATKIYNHFPNNEHITLCYAQIGLALSEHSNAKKIERLRDIVYDLCVQFPDNKDLKNNLLEIKENLNTNQDKECAYSAYKKAKSDYLCNKDSIDYINQYADSLCNLLEFNWDEKTLDEVKKMLTFFYKTRPNDAEMIYRYAKMLAYIVYCESSFKSLQLLKNLHIKQGNTNITNLYAEAASEYTLNQDSHLKSIVAELKTMFENDTNNVRLAKAYALGLYSLAEIQKPAQRIEIQKELKNLMIRYPDIDDIKSYYEDELYQYEWDCENGFAE